MVKSRLRRLKPSLLNPRPVEETRSDHHNDSVTGACRPAHAPPYPDLDGIGHHGQLWRTTQGEHGSVSYAMQHSDSFEAITARQLQALVRLARHDPSFGIDATELALLER